LEGVLGIISTLIKRLLKKTTVVVILLFTAIAPVIFGQSAPNAGQIAYYKQTGVVSQDKKKSGGDNTGQFIRFTEKSCYDSDKAGYDIGNGYLMYKGMVNDIHVYNGDSFLGGQKGYYYFNKDLSRLHVETADGVTYVYEKAAAPAGVVTSAKIYKKPETETVVRIPAPPVPPIGPVGPVINREILPPPPPPDHTAELRRLQSRYNELKRMKADQERYLNDSYTPVIDSGIAKGYFDTRNSYRETIRLYERQMRDIEQEAWHLGGSVY
jgi:hypothetical protein